MRLPKYKHKRARIEIVPMIDTIFFLLVYFLVASLSMTQMSAQKVRLPESVTASEHPSDRVIVTVSRDGHCYIDRNAVDEMKVTQALDTRLKANKNLTVVINCDKDQPVASFNRIFDLVKQSQAASVMVATTPRDPWNNTP